MCLSNVSTDPRKEKNRAWYADLGMSNSWRARIKLYGVAMLVGLAVGLYAIILHKHGLGDFASLYRADALLLSDMPIYWPPPEVNPDSACPESKGVMELAQFRAMTIEELVKVPPCSHPNLNPPIFILLTAPLAYLGFDRAWLFWFIVSLACLATTIGLVQRERLIPHGLASFLYASLACLLYVPTLASLFIGQVTFQILLPIVLGWLSLRRGQDWAGGAWLGLAASLKPFVGLCLLVLMVLRNGRATLSMIGVGLACIALGWLVGGWATYRDYLEALQSVSWHAASWNASLAGFFSRPLGGSTNIPWLDAPELARALTRLVSQAVLVLLGMAAWRNRDRAAVERADTLMALSPPAMLLLSPLGWLYYFPFLLPCALVLWRAGVNMPNPGHYRLALSATLILSSMPSWIITAKQMNDPLDWFGAPGFYTIALLQLFALAVIAALRQTPPLLANDPALEETGRP